DPFAVAIDEVALDLGGALARGEALADDHAHLARHFRGRIGHREVLADDATELRGDLIDGLLADRARALSRLRRCGAEQDQRGQQGGRHPAHGEAVSASSLSTVVLKTSSVTAPTCLTRIRPWRSTKNVSGTPYTP